MSLYSTEHRALQDQFDSRTIADVLEAIIVQPMIDDEAKAFIESRSFFFLSTVNPDGQPTVSHKGGAAGFVRVVDATTIVFPNYDGNGMFLSMGNIVGDGRIGLLFMDFERPHRVRAHATATVSHDDPLMGEYPGADLLVRATITDVFVNCPRYIGAQGAAKFAPDHEGNAPMPSWQKIDALQPFLPTRLQGKAESEGGVITTEEYAQRLHDGNT